MATTDSKESNYPCLVSQENLSHKVFVETHTHKIPFEAQKKKDKCAGISVDVCVIKVCMAEFEPKLIFAF